MSFRVATSVKMNRILECLVCLKSAALGRSVEVTFLVIYVDGIFEMFVFLVSRGLKPQTSGVESSAGRLCKLCSVHYDMCSCNALRLICSFKQSKKKLKKETPLNNCNENLHASVGARLKLVFTPKVRCTSLSKQLSRQLLRHL